MGGKESENAGRGRTSGETEEEKLKRKRNLKKKIAGKKNEETQG